MAENSVPDNSMADLWAAGPPAGSWRRYLVADVFTAIPLQGNQLGVFPDGRGLDGALMQPTARELNLSETVFFLPSEQGCDARVRIFTPVGELPFAGHPVLGSAFVLGDLLGTAKVSLQTGLGPVPVELEREGERVVFGRMEQLIPVAEPFERVAELLAALGLSGLGVRGSGLPVEAYRNGPRHVYVELASEAEVAGLSPDLRGLAELQIGVSCFAGQGASWKTRMFAPFLGVPEDPATGSAA